MVYSPKFLRSSVNYNSILYPWRINQPWNFHLVLLHHGYLVVSVEWYWFISLIAFNEWEPNVTLAFSWAHCNAWHLPQSVSQWELKISIQYLTCLNEIWCQWGHSLKDYIHFNVTASAVLLNKCFCLKCKEIININLL